MTLTKIGEVRFPEETEHLSSPHEFIGNQPSLPTAPVNIFLNSKMTMQTMVGIGGAFSELGGKALLSLEETERKQVAKELFSQHLNFFRLPVGSSDFALDAYSLNDQEGDFEMKHFSLARDAQYLQPYMALAKEYCPEMSLHISPWSPPAWLKEDGNMGGGSPLIDKPEYYEAYAKYFVKYIQSYEALGYSVRRLNVQNEPDVSPAYPSCQMSEKQMAHFIKEYLHPALSKANITTELFAGTFRSLNGASASDFLTTTEGIEKYISGIGMQYSAMQPIYDVLSCPKYQHLKFMHTESNCFDGQNSWTQAATLYQSIVSYLTAGCDSFTYWNMILDETGKSTWGWAQNSLVGIEEATKKVQYYPDFWVMQLASRCILPQSKRISYVSRDHVGIATVQQDGSVRFLCSNFHKEAKEGKVVLNGEELKISLEPMSISGFSIG